MRRFYVSMLLASLVLLGVGCGDATDTDSEVTLEYETYEGEIQSLGSVELDNQATHLLRLEDGAVVYLHSTDYDLSDDMYEDNVVVLSGYVTPASEDMNKPTMNVDRLEILSIEDEDDALVYRDVYINADLGFAIEYESDWEVAESVNRVVFTAPVVVDELELSPPDPDTITVTVRANNESLSVAEWYTAYEALDPGDPTYSESVVSEDQYDAVRVDQGDTTIYYVGLDSTIFVIAHEAVQLDLLAEYANLFNEMLYSFDPLADGQRLELVDPPEAADEDETTETSSDDDDDDDDETGTTLSSEDYKGIMEAVDAQLLSLLEVGGDWSPLYFEFAGDEYVYVVAQEDDTETLRRLLLMIVSDDEFGVLARFKEGSVTDWELESGTDEAKGIEKVKVTVGSDDVVTILEGYRWFKSDSLNFQIQYPSNWYYARSGNSFYFSDAPANADNALVILEVADGDMESPLEPGTHDGTFVAQVARDDDSHFVLSGPEDHSDVILTMSDTLEVVE